MIHQKRPTRRFSLAFALWLQRVQGSRSDAEFASAINASLSRVKRAQKGWEPMQKFRSGLTYGLFVRSRDAASTVVSDEPPFLSIRLPIRRPRPRAAAALLKQTNRVTPQP